MEPSFTYPTILGKAERYARFLEDFRLFMDGETDLIAALSNTAAALREAFGFFWVGFYLVKDEQWLTLGPFQGTVACTRIRRGRGVCGTAWVEGRTLIVPDVDVFPGHIACSSLSRSEIVVPLKHPTNGHILGILDIDSNHLNAFDATDLQGLEAIVASLLHCIFEDSNKSATT
ncbi:MAG: GAF domain-containing protein [Bacteroidaceae bacterium]|nr:GAF domain-containing protein [Bacteroidaceae bacterium]